jgi:hypothetical protein
MLYLKLQLISHLRFGADSNDTHEPFFQSHQPVGTHRDQPK